ncbi:MarR family winged helix-turn-helix transcriptional regulator [Methylobacterium sp. C25]|uniref:MarR family winged helix-turn-helix transcriptional regulator n=1 Tax=Methylobacterium sp. C25 TaxID=2721622 RepID=UPI001F3BCA83|nr:MarR family transcriptional regulator [Methylobacterium sp. C25]
MDPSPDLAMRRAFVTQLMETAQILRGYVDRRARARGTSRAQWLVLLRLSEREGLSQVELATALDLKPISVVPLLDQLVVLGLVERRRGTIDRRTNHLHLTTAGRATVADLDGLRSEIAQSVLNSANVTDIQLGLDLLLQTKRTLREAQSAS